MSVSYLLKNNRHLPLLLTALFVVFGKIVVRGQSYVTLYEESFETNFGDWQKNTGTNAWQRDEGTTPSSSTGPTGAADGNFFIYTEASSSTVRGVESIITGPAVALPPGTGGRLTFSYHMYGSSMGTLSLEISDNGGSSWSRVWTKSGNQDNQWEDQIVSLASYGDRTITARFVGLVGSGFRSDMAVDDIVIESNSSGPASLASTLDCQVVISQFPYTEGFESSEGDWVEESDGANIWRRKSGGTGSSGTGPGGAQAGGYYIYTEASSPNYPNKDGYFVGPCFDFSAIRKATLTFDYHMYGANMGSLHVEVLEEGQTEWRRIWSQSGETGNLWIPASVKLNSLKRKKFKLRLYGQTGSSYRSDMAVDNIRIVATNEANLASGCNTPISSFPYTESFESSWGGWVRSGNYNIWLRATGNSPSGSTGPYEATHQEYYAYTETSGTNRWNRKATLVGPCFDLAGGHAAEFYFKYHLRGKDINIIRLEVSNDGGVNWQKVWRKKGESIGPLGGNWHQAIVDLRDYLDQVIQLRFVTITGSGYRGDIAIDDLYFDVPDEPVQKTLAGGVYHLGSDPYAPGMPESVGVPNVLMSIDELSGATPYYIPTGPMGNFSATHTVGKTTLVPLTQDNNSINGLSIADVVAIYGHIQGSNTIEDPLKRLAADVNKDGKITSADADLIQDLLGGQLAAFPNVNAWQTVSEYFVRQGADYFHPDEKFSADFWNNSSGTINGKAFPFAATLRAPDQVLTYANSESWMNGLRNWYLEGGPSPCAPSPNFIAFRTGDVTGNANPANLTLPPVPTNLSQAAVVAKSLKKQESDIPPRKGKRRRFKVFVYAHSEKKIHGFQTAIRYDPEIIDIRRVDANTTDLYTDAEGAFTDGSNNFLGDPLLRTVWVDTTGRGKRFRRRNASSEDGKRSRGKVLFKFTIDCYGNRTAAAHALSVDDSRLQTVFYNKRGKPIEDVDYEIFLEKKKPKSGNEKALVTTIPFEDGGSGISVYPNPASKTFFVKAPNGAPAGLIVELIDQAGRTIRRIPLSGPGATRVTTDGIRPGIYFVSFQIAGSIVHSQRLVVKD